MKMKLTSYLGAAQELERMLNDAFDEIKQIASNVWIYSSDNDEDEMICDIEDALIRYGIDRDDVELEMI